MTAFLNLRGLKTLALRMKQHTINALTLASLFDDLELKHVYPGFGGMVSLDLGSRENAKKFIEQLVGPTLAVSLGETQTLINVPALMTHAAYSNEELKAIGLGPGQIRISVGIEEPCKLRKEFKKALEGI
jgi:cystathionine beta-lyase/cystathionine gamma-synthase